MRTSSHPGFWVKITQLKGAGTQTLKNFSMNEQQELLEFVFDDWKGDVKQTDDVSLIGITL